MKTIGIAGNITILAGGMTAAGYEMIVIETCGIGHRTFTWNGTKGATSDRNWRAQSNSSRVSFPIP